MKTIITISRQFGSGGRLVGKLLSEKLNIPFYDKEIINQASEKSGFANDFIQENEQKMRPMSNYAFGSTFMGGNLWSNIENIETKIYSYEANAIKDFAKQGPCIFVGRCADYVLRDEYKCLNVFIHADIEHRVARIIDVYNLLDNPKKAEKMIRNTDKMRAKHYMFYTDATWGDAENYDISIDSGRFGIEQTAEIIKAIYLQIDAE